MNEIKLTRICYNTEQWNRPSGTFGKSKGDDLFESEYGYGLEEWLSNELFDLGEYRYGFIEGVRHAGEKHIGKVYDLILFTYYNSKFHAVGQIKSAEILSPNDIELATLTIQKNDKNGEIKKHLNGVSTSPYMSEFNTVFKVNIRFKPGNLIWFDEKKEINLKHGLWRYQLYSPDETTLQKIDHVHSDQEKEVISDLLEILNRESDKSDSERETLVLARVGQGKFRDNVINFWGNGEKCAVTLMDIKGLLVASHIQAWRDCESTDERLDGANGILLCAHIDKLFDRHIITFYRRGNDFILALSKHYQRYKIDFSQLQIKTGESLATAKLTPAQVKRLDRYMKKHNAIFEEKENNRIA